MTADRSETLLNPILISEVLSPSTEAYDRGFKFAQYQQIESLQEYVLISQQEPRVERFRRQMAGEWLFSTHAGMDASCPLDCLDTTIPLAEIYDKIVFGTTEAPDRPSPGV